MKTHRSRLLRALTVALAGRDRAGRLTGTTAPTGSSPIRTTRQPRSQLGLFGPKPTEAAEAQPQPTGSGRAAPGRVSAADAHAAEGEAPAASHRPRAHPEGRRLRRRPVRHLRGSASARCGCHRGLRQLPRSALCPAARAGRCSGPSCPGSGRAYAAQFLTSPMPAAGLRPPRS